METGAEAVRLLDQREPGAAARHLLFLDADLGATAAAAGPLITPVAAGEADLAIAVFASRVKQGGHGFVVGLSAAGIRRATGWTPAQPLNGQRCLTRAAFDAARPLARGFGVETAMTIDLKRKGLRSPRSRWTSRAGRPAGPAGAAAPCPPVRRRRLGARHPPVSTLGGAGLAAIAVSIAGTVAVGAAGIRSWRRRCQAPPAGCPGALTCASVRTSRSDSPP